MKEQKYVIGWSPEGATASYVDKAGFNLGPAGHIVIDKTEKGYNIRASKVGDGCSRTMDVSSKNNIQNVRRIGELLLEDTLKAA